MPNKNYYTQRQWDRVVGYGKVPDKYKLKEKGGRKSAKSSKRKYPVCRPKAVANRMTAGQKAAAVKRKRAKTNTGPKPTSIRYPISASGKKQKVKTKRRA